MEMNFFSVSKNHSICHTIWFLIGELQRCLQWLIGCIFIGLLHCIHLAIEFNRYLIPTNNTLASFGYSIWNSVSFPRNFIIIGWSIVCKAKLSNRGTMFLDKNWQTIHILMPVGNRMNWIDFTRNSNGLGGGESLTRWLTGWLRPWLRWRSFETTLGCVASSTRWRSVTGNCGGGFAALPHDGSPSIATTKSLAMNTRTRHDSGAGLGCHLKFEDSRVLFSQWRASQSSFLKWNVGRWMEGVSLRRCGRSGSHCPAEMSGPNFCLRWAWRAVAGSFPVCHNEAPWYANDIERPITRIHRRWLLWTQIAPSESINRRRSSFLPNGFQLGVMLATRMEKPPAFRANFPWCGMLR